MCRKHIGVPFQGNMFFPVERGGVYEGGGPGGVTGGANVATIIMAGLTVGFILKLTNTSEK